MRHQLGLALVTLLLLLGILAIYSLYAMQNTVLEKKVLSAYRDKQHMTLVSESILSEVEEAVQFKTPICYAQAGLTSALSCAGNSTVFQYYYKVEALPQQACVFMTVFNKRVAVDFLRISLRLVAIAEPHAQRIVQSIIARPAQSVIPCNDVMHRVAKGRQTFREIEV